MFSGKRGMAALCLVVLHPSGAVGRGAFSGGSGLQLFRGFTLVSESACVAISSQVCLRCYD